MTHYISETTNAQKIAMLLACVASVSVDFFRSFEAFFAYWWRENWGERNKSEKCFKPAESLTETLATQVTMLQFATGSILWAADLRDLATVIFSDKL